MIPFVFSSWIINDIIWYIWRLYHREPNSDACGVFLCVLFYIMEIVMFQLMKDETAALADNLDRAAYVNCTRGNLKLKTAAT